MPHKILRYTRVLGVDPSLRATGWAVVENGSVRDARRLSLRSLGYGTIRVPASVSLSEALLRIHKDISMAIATHKPEVCAIESTIYVQSHKTAIILGAVRGAALLAAAQAGLAVTEFAPRQVKRSLTGRGGAKKDQVAFMVRALLELDHTPDVDAADALATTIAYFQRNLLTSGSFIL